MNKKLTRGRHLAVVRTKPTREDPEGFILSDLWALAALLVIIGGFYLFVSRGGI